MCSWPISQESKHDVPPSSSTRCFNVSVSDTSDLHRHLFFGWETIRSVRPQLPHAAAYSRRVSSVMGTQDGSAEFRRDVKVGKRCVDVTRTCLKRNARWKPGADGTGF